jgi:hypothetical protein
MRIDLDAFPEALVAGNDLTEDGFGLTESIGFRLSKTAIPASRAASTAVSASSISASP